MQSKTNPKLAIIVPTNERKRTVLKTVQDIYLEYQNNYMEFIILILDSSLEPIKSDFINNNFIEYIHCPSVLFTEKPVLAIDVINKNHDSVKWVLFHPDDDLFLPSQNFLKDLSKNKDFNKHVYIPSRYLMFKNIKKPFNCLQCIESWSHHSHISNIRCSWKKRVSQFSSEGVLSSWGFFSLKGFKEVIYLKKDLGGILSFDQRSIIEDISNIFVLSYEWEKLDNYPICLRGDDRRFRSKKGWIPSWKVLENIESLDNILNLLSKSLQNVIANNYPNIKSNLPHKNFLTKMISDHVLGYKLGRSRLYDLGPPLLIKKEYKNSSEEYIRQYSFGYFFRKKTYLLLPFKKEEIFSTNFPNHTILGNEELINFIFKYKNMFFENRES